MPVNNILEKMNRGEKAYGLTFIFPSEELIELAGLAGFDFVFLDGEHGSFTTRTIESHCRTADAAGLTTIARVPNIESDTILRFLDRGVLGIMGPHICTAKDAQKLADACRFVPEGKRSFGSGRGVGYGTPSPRADSMQQLNNQMLVMALLEDQAALDNLSEITGVNGIDFFSFGPNDLAQSMGLPGEPDHPQVIKSMNQATHEIKASGKRMLDEVCVTARAAEMFLESGRAFVNNFSSNTGK